MSTTLHALTAAADVAQNLAATLPTDLGIPDKGSIAPDGVAEKFATVIGVARWIAGGIAILGLIGIGASWFINNRREAAGEKTTPLMWWAGGALIIGSVFSIAGMFI